MQLHVFEPEGHQASERAPAMVLFFGGGWNGGRPQQLYGQCVHFAKQGMVAISAEYRVKSQHGATPIDCVKDAKSAIRWIRSHAAENGIDAERLVAGGASAGGHLAAAAGTNTSIEEADEHDVDCRPNALVLLNPVFDNGPDGYGYERVSEYWQKISPMHNIDDATPPTIVFFGTQDKHVPVATAKAYQKRMEAIGKRCELFLYEGQTHGFFNHKEGGNEKQNHYFRQTMRETDRFLTSLGILN